MRTRTRTARSVAALALAALLAGGCGGSSKPLTRAQYEQRTSAALRGLLDEMRQNLGAPGALDGPVRHCADKLARLKPPPADARVHARLVDGLRGVADDLHDVASAGSITEAQRALDRLSSSPGGLEVEQALRDLRARGYHLPTVFGVRGSSH